jgi:hypothetical protein
VGVLADAARKQTNEGEGKSVLDGAAAAAAAAAGGHSASASSTTAAAAAATKHSDALKKAVSETLRMAREFKESYKTPPGVGIEYRDAQGKLKHLKGGSKREWNGAGFCTPVHSLLAPPLAEEYAREVPFPMDLGTIRLKATGGQYRALDELAADVRLVADNCRTFPGSLGLVPVAEEIQRKAGELLAGEYVRLAAAAAAAGGGHVAALRLKLEKLTALAASRRTLATAFWSQK